MPITDIDYQLVDTWTNASGDKVRNVYFIKDVIGGGSAADCVEYFDGEIIPLLAACLSSSMTHESINMFNLVDEFDFKLELDSTPGDLTGTRMPDFVAASIRFARSRRGVRDGHKRYGTLTTALCTGNDLSAAGLSAFGALLTGLTILWEAGESGYRLNIPTRTFNPVSGKYELTDLLAFDSAEIQGLTTQNSRKPGRGE